MNYLKNESGDVKVANEKGDAKWIPKHLAEDAILMRTQGLKPVESPIAFEYKTETLPVEETPVVAEGLTPVEAPIAKAKGKKK